MNHMMNYCKWMDGRRDVALDGNQRTGGSPVGCGDYQAVQ